MNRQLVFAMALVVSFAISPVVRSEEIKPKPTLASVDSRINSIRVVLKRLLEALAVGKKSNDIQRVNCLQVKVNLIKGLLKASEKANLVFLEASFSKDASTAESYGKKVEMYGSSADDIGKSIDECSGVETKPDGTALVYIRPEEPELVTSETNPWGGTDGVSGVEGYPVVPPASPFR